MPMTMIGVIGVGVVGKAVVEGFGIMGHTVVTYDKSTDKELPEEFKKVDFTFVCVPTPTLNTEEQDLSNIIEVLSLLSPWYSGVVILSSTILPGTTQRLQNIYPELRIVCSPQFVTESTALQDFLRPDKVLIGVPSEREHDYGVGPLLRSFYGDRIEVKVVRAEVAEMTKYMVNSYYALRVVFANQIYDLCEVLGIDYEEVRECFELDKRVAPGHFEVFYKGKKTRGYRGKCLPKDLDALVNLGSINDRRLTLLEEVSSINKCLQKIREELLVSGAL